MILCINSASNNTEIALINKSKVINEKSWLSNRNESEKIIPEIKNLIKESNISNSEISGICVVNGPGSYTKLRIGVSIANAFAFATSISVKKLNQFQLLFLKQKKIQKTDVIINAGRENVYLYQDMEDISTFDIKEVKIIDINKYIAHRKNQKIVSDLNDDQKKIISSSGLNLINNELSFGEALSSVNISIFPSEKTVTPLYIREAQVTKSKKIRGKKIIL